MKIRKARVDRRRRRFEIETYSGSTYAFPYAKADPPPTVRDPVVHAYPDPELGKEGVTYVLASGAEGSVHIDHFLEYNEDPATMRRFLVYKLSLLAREHCAESPLAMREIARRLGTSPAQIYRLIDPAQQRKSLDALVELLAALDCNVDVVVRPKAA